MQDMLTLIVLAIGKMAVGKSNTVEPPSHGRLRTGAKDAKKRQENNGVV
jgi:hypothetical protein